MEKLKQIFKIKPRDKMKKPKTGMVDKPGIGGRIADVIIWLLIILFLFCCLVPFWHVIMCSISDGLTLFGTDGLVLWPKGKVNFEGYALLFEYEGVWRGFLNTILYVVGSAGLGLIINCIAGYVLSRKTRFKTVMSLIVLFTTMFNGGLIPTYMVVRSLGFVGTPFALIIPGCTNAFFIMMCMNAFASVPQGTVESAQIDGAGHIRTMFVIMLPQCFNLIVVVLLNSVIMAWNAWLPASIYLPRNTELWPLQLWIREIIAQNENFINSVNPNYSRYLIQYATIVIGTLPILIAFPFFIRIIERGGLRGAIKE